MLYPVIVMLKRRAGIVRRIDVDALHLSGEFLFQSLEAQEVVPMDQDVVEDVLVRDAVRGMVRLARVLNQNTRLQLRPVRCV